MHPYFNITKDEIKTLKNEQARELVARLCQAELISRQISPAYVHWGGDQFAPDGGTDVLVDIDSKEKIKGFIPSPYSVFQVKAESKFPRNKVINEIYAKKDHELKECFHNANKLFGSYVIVNTKSDLTSKNKELFENSIKSEIQKHGCVNLESIKFYDSQKIADWIINHPSVSIWVRKELGKPLEGWQGYGSWSYLETDVNAEYIIDVEKKIYFASENSEFTALEAIGRLRSMCIEKSIVRIVGLSGVGKTRFVQALYDERIETSSKSLEKNMVIYGDISDQLNPKPSVMLNALCMAKFVGTLVIDNCSIGLHKELTDILQKNLRPFSLLTVEYDIQDDSSEQTDYFRLSASSEQLIINLLRRRYKHLSLNDIYKVAEVSGGNSRVAIAIADTSEKSDELSKLTDRELFKRLFYQRNAENENLIRCAEAASLVYSFEFKGYEESSETGILAKLADVSTSEFYRNINQLEKRGLIQKRTFWRALLPHAIANRLALEAIENISNSVLKRVFSLRENPRLTVSFARRLGYLNEHHDGVKRIAAELYENHNLLSLDIYNDENAYKVFKTTAHINPIKSMEIIEYGFDNELINENNSHLIQDFVAVLSYLAYEEHYFGRCIDILQKIWKFEMVNPVWFSFGAKSNILKFFSMYLSGTKASPKTRFAKLEEWFFGGSITDKTLIGELVNSILQVNHFTSAGNRYEYGSSKRDEGWQPKIYKDQFDWVILAISISKQLAIESADFADTARAQLAQNLRSILRRYHDVSQIKEVILKSSEEIHKAKPWSDGWIAIKQTIGFDFIEENLDIPEYLLVLEELLRPANLKEKVYAHVFERGMLDDDLLEVANKPEASYEQYYVFLESLGRQVASNKELLYECLNEINSQSHYGKLWRFGIGIGKEYPRPEEIFIKLKMVKSEKEINLNFLSGFIEGAYRSKPDEVELILESYLNDDFWRYYFPILQIPIANNDRAFVRLLESLDKRLSPVYFYSGILSSQFVNAYSLKIRLLLTKLIDTCTQNELSKLNDELKRLTILKDEFNKVISKEISEIIGYFLTKIDWKTANKSFLNEIGSCISYFLENSASEEQGILLLSTIMESYSSKQLNNHFGMSEVIKPFIIKYPERTLDLIYIKNMDYFYFVDLFKEKIQISIDETIVKYVPCDQLIAWCNKSPEDRFPFAIRTVNIVDEQAYNKPFDKYEISSELIQLIDAIPDKSKAFSILSNRLKPVSYSGSYSGELSSRLILIQKLFELVPDETKPLVKKLIDKWNEDIRLNAESESSNSAHNWESFE